MALLVERHGLFLAHSDRRETASFTGPCTFDVFRAARLAAVAQPVYDLDSHVARSFRRLLSLVVVAAFTSLNVGVAELHVHADQGQASGEHSHGPASHYHEAVHHESPEAPHVAAVDADDTVVAVPLVIAPPRLPKPMAAVTVEPVPVSPDEPARVDGSHIVARAHGPPLTVQHSLRAPPPPASL